MEIFQILNWLLTFCLLAVAIMSGVMLRHRAGLLLALALGTMFLGYLLLRIWYATELSGIFGHVTIQIISTLFHVAWLVLLMLAVLEFRKMLGAGSIAVQPYSSSNQYTTLSAQGHLANTVSTGRFGSILIYMVPIFIGIVLMISGILQFNQYSTLEEGLVLFALGAFSLMGAVIYLMVMLYRVWRFIIVQCHRHQIAPSIETPGKAVGFLFIPFFSLYWVFIAFGKLPKDINAIAAARGQAPVISEGLGLSVAIMMAIGGIPYIGIPFALIAEIILIPILMYQVIRICQALYHSDLQQTQQAPVAS